jgi:hypothetical protein
MQTSSERRLRGAKNMLPPSWKGEIEKTVEETTHTNSEQRKAQQDNAVATIAAAIKALRDAQEAQTSHEDRNDKKNRRINVTTLILVFLTLIFTGLSWWTFHEQVNEMKLAYGPIKQTADATKAALVAGQRAWVRIDEIGVGGGGLSIGNDGASVSISFMVTNVGNSPAIKVTYHPKLVVLAQGVAIPSEQEQVCDAARHQWQGGFTLFPNEQFPRTLGLRQPSFGGHASKDTIERGAEISADKKRVALLVVGCVDYDALRLP